MSIKQVQCLLLYLGYDVGAVDGICGKQTQAAVKQFQADFGGIGVDGISGEETQKALKYAVAYGTLKRETTEASAAVGGAAMSLLRLVPSGMKLNISSGRNFGAPMVSAVAFRWNRRRRLCGQ